jgi:hypothetical protein
VAAVEKIKESASPQIFSGTATGKAPSTARNPRPTSNQRTAPNKKSASVLADFLSIYKIRF